MTKDQIIAWAREAGFARSTFGIALDGSPKMRLVFDDSKIEVFAQLVAAQAAAEEREACAKVCDLLYAPASCNAIERALWSVAMQDCAAAIRERKSL